jgi:hypothetical protein
MRFGRHDLRLFAKTMLLVGGEGSPKLRGFNATFGGVSYALTL